jgi:hypothetical protein
MSIFELENRYTGGGSKMTGDAMVMDGRQTDDATVVAVRVQ